MVAQVDNPSRDDWCCTDCGQRHSSPIEMKIQNCDRCGAGMCLEWSVERGFKVHPLHAFLVGAMQMPDVIRGGQS